MNDQLASVGRTEVLANLTSVSTPISVSTVDGVLRSPNTQIDERIAAVRDEMRNQGRPHGSCGGVGGGWGD